MEYVLDHELAAVVATLPDLTGPGLADLAAMREHVRQTVAAMPVYEPGQKLEVSDITVPGYQGAPDVRARIYTPAVRHHPLPGLLYLHGGAFAFGDLDSGGNAAAAVADRADVVVVSMDYRWARELVESAAKPRSGPPAD